MKKRFLTIFVVVLFIVGLTSAFAGGAKEKKAEKKAVEEKPITKEAPAAEKKVSLKIKPLPPWETYNLTDWEKKSGKKITTYHEAPMLTKMVAAGEIPPLKERLPKEPLVVKPAESIGKYGGTLVFAGTNLMYVGDFNRNDTCFEATQYGDFTNKTHPNAMKGFKQSDDGKTITLYLREGLKWSDGHPVTADDVIYAFNDVAFGPKELRYARDGEKFMVDGKKPKIVRVNDYEVRFEYPAPHWNFMRNFTYLEYRSIIFPKHVCIKYDIRYNKDANKVAKEYGFDNWTQLFDVLVQMPCAGPEKLNKEWPVLGAWRFKKQITGGMIFERNPYYFQIDTEGNQLPYIDEVKLITVENIELFKAKAISGEVDYASWGLMLDAYPMYAEEAQKGKYKVYLRRGDYMANTTYWFNLDYQGDPQVGKLLADKHFRQAMSLAINRDYINDTLYFGKGIPIQLTLSIDLPYYKEEWGRAYADYDPKRANAILDEMGLKWDADHKFRQFKDGNTVTVEVVVMTDHHPDYVPTLEIVKENWKDVGINVNVKPVTKSYQKLYCKTNKFQIRSRSTCYFTDTFSIAERRAAEVGPTKCAYRWYTWAKSGGKKGVEPPEKWKEWVLKTNSLAKMQQSNPKEAVKTIIWAFDLQAEQLFGIGTVGYVPRPIIVANGLGNIPTETYGDTVYIDPWPPRQQDFYWKK